MEDQPSRLQTLMTIWPVSLITCALVIPLVAVIVGQLFTVDGTISVLYAVGKPLAVPVYFGLVAGEIMLLAYALCLCQGSVLHRWLGRVTYFVPLGWLLFMLWVSGSGVGVLGVRLGSVQASIVALLYLAALVVIIERQRLAERLKNRA